MEFELFLETLEKYGFVYTKYTDVVDKNNKTGVRYDISKNTKSKYTEEDLKKELKKVLKDKIIISEGTYKYAPEIKRLSIILLD